jgi:predicted PurR-regulated permease PerM
LEDVPNGVRIAASWAWRFLVLGGAVWVLMQVISALQIVVVPLAIALLLCALLQPASAWLRARGLPPSLAAALVMIGGLTVVVGVLAAVVQQFVKGSGDLSDNVSEGIGKVRDWLNDGPAHLSNDQIDQALQNLGKLITENRDFAGTALDTAATAFHVLAGFFLVLFTTFFFLKDGAKIWGFLTRFLPGHVRSPVQSAGYLAWATLISYVRATVFVAAVDALGIGMAVWLLGVPLALPLAALVFLTAFIPIIGATLSGVVAVLVALVTKGPVVALLILAAVIAVQQLEGHVLQPLLMGRAVAIHPLAVLLAIATGAVLAGIIGALVAVPLVAVLNTGVRHLVRHHTSATEPAPSTG